MIDLRQDGDVHILQFTDGDNRFTIGMLDELDKALDALTAAPGPKALVTTGTGKFYSNGLDLDWLGEDQERWGPYLGRIYGLLGRMLTLPMPTVAAINGHAFAAGGILALTHDHRVMRTGRGYFCLPEVDLGLPFSPELSAVIQAKLPKATAHEAMVTGRRYTAEEAMAADIVHQTAPEEEVVRDAVAVAASLAAKDGETIARIRRTMYATVLETLG
jgi:enoyl-CoA hydratase/carnithine racemase